MGNRSSVDESSSNTPQLNSNIRDIPIIDVLPSAAVSSSQQLCPPSPSDKATIALPLRDKRCGKGITAFVDEADIPCGTFAIQAMTHAMETAKIGVFNLSPEFIAKKWPMRELLHFLKRQQEFHRISHNGHEAPTIIPCFYRLGVADLYQEHKLDRKGQDGKLLYAEARFFERRDNGELEADVENIKAALKTLHGIMGVRNDVEVNNDSSYLMSKRRRLLPDELCSEICKSVPERMMTMYASSDTVQGRIRYIQVCQFPTILPSKAEWRKSCPRF